MHITDCSKRWKSTRIKCTRHEKCTRKQCTRESRGCTIGTYSTNQDSKTQINRIRTTASICTTWKKISPGLYYRNTFWLTQQTISTLTLPITFKNMDFDQLITAMGHDKANDNNVVRNKYSNISNFKGKSLIIKFSKKYSLAQAVDFQIA